MALSWPPGAFPDALGSMTISLHKLTAGTGYTYLTRQVAAHDRAGGPRTSLASYYSDRGETPGRWVGSGVAGIDGLAVGDEVTAEQMRLLFGFGLHPLADQREERLAGPGLTERDYRAARRLGVPFKVYTAEATAFQVEVAKADRGPQRRARAPARLPRCGPGPGPNPLQGRHASSSVPSTDGTRATPASCPGPSRSCPAHGPRRWAGTT